MNGGYFQLARLKTRNRQWEAALEVIDRSLIRNWSDHQGRHLKAAILRHLGKMDEALTLCDDSLKTDPFNFGVLFEKYLLKPDHAEYLSALKDLIRGNIHNYIEVSLDYAWAGLWNEAIQLTELGISEQGNKNIYPMVWYYKASYEYQNGDHAAAAKTLETAAAACPDYCFPNQPEAIIALEWAARMNPSDYKSYYYLGNFRYHTKSDEEAIVCWERSTAVNDHFPTVHRNLALAYFNKRHDPAKALAELEKAFSLDETDARILMELDQLYKRLNYKPQVRLELLQKYPVPVNDRDDLYLEQISLYNLLGEHEKAQKLLMSRKFHPWEGGEGKVTAQYVFSLTEMAKKAIREKEYEKAIAHLTRTQVYPENLGEGKLYGARENEQLYWMGIAFEGLENSEQAKTCWEKAAHGPKEITAVMFYNDQQPDTVFYQGLALQKLGMQNEAASCFDLLIRFGREHLHDHIKIDYFAVSLPNLLIWEDDLDFRNHQLCQYLQGLGELGKGNPEKAVKRFDSILKSEQTHSGALIHQKIIQSLIE